MLANSKGPIGGKAFSAKAQGELSLARSPGYPPGVSSSDKAKQQRLSHVQV